MKAQILLCLPSSLKKNRKWKFHLLAPKTQRLDNYVPSGCKNFLPYIGPWSLLPFWFFRFISVIQQLSESFRLCWHKTDHPLRQNRSISRERSINTVRCARSSWPPHVAEWPESLCYIDGTEVSLYYDFSWTQGLLGGLSLSTTLLQISSLGNPFCMQAQSRKNS